LLNTVKLGQNVDKHDEGRIQFKSIGADTGRLSCPQGDEDQGFLGVPFHGIPKASQDAESLSARIREAIEARPGYFMVKIDFAGEELRIATNMSGEPTWIKEFNEGSGDLHSLMSQGIFGTVKDPYRGYAKSVNFGLLYGGGPRAVQRSTGLPKEKCDTIVADYFKKVPTLKKYIDSLQERARRDGVLRTALGRPLFLPDASSSDRTLQGIAMRKAVNSPIQGTGADILKWAMGRIDTIITKEHNWYPDIVRPIINVHDEIVFEVKAEYLEEIVPILCAAMTSISKVLNWVVPLEVEPLVGKYWSAKNNWYKMKAGKSAIPDFLKAYITPEKEFVPEVKKEEEVKTETATEANMPELRRYDTLTYRLNRPVSNSTYTLLRSICELSQIPTVTTHKTALKVSTITGEEIFGTDANIFVDAYKFTVLAEYLGL
jgi:DNA polymerase I-like protein with 3'-5' exonuclease and polymerase domains